jgi:hypothetical protein
MPLVCRLDALGEAEAGRWLDESMDRIARALRPALASYPIRAGGEIS